MLTVRTPPTYKPERKYIIQVLLRDFLGIDFHVEFQDRQNISIGDKDGKELIISDVLFQTPQNQWLVHYLKSNLAIKNLPKNDD